MVVNSSYVQALISIIRIVAQDSSTCQDSTVNHCVISVVWKDPSLLLASSKLIMSVPQQKVIEIQLQSERH